MLIALIVTITLQLMVIYVPFLNTIFKTAPLTLTELAITIGVSSIVFWAVELEKAIKRILTNRKKS
jgi:Ca2+-transporting ATPase